MYDSFNRAITYLRVSVTDRCNLRCTYCMPAEGVTRKSHAEILRYEQIVEVVAAAATLGIDKVRLTGGEPLVRRGIVHLVRELKAVPGIRELALTTNGMLLAGMARDLRQAGLARLNVSLDTLDADKYARLTRGGRIENVLAGIEAARQVGFQRLKINMVLLPEFNQDEVPGLQRFCLERGLELQRIHRYRLPEGLPAAGRPAEAERPQDCRRCNRIRLTADGRLKPCLFNETEFTLDFGDLRKTLERAIRAKPASGLACRNRGNWQIGG